MGPSANASDRLDRLEGFLREDPANPHLLAEAFDVALRGARWDRAEFHLRHAQAVGLERVGWLLREAQWLIAQRRWSEARAHLLGLEASFESSARERATLIHDLAYVELQLGEYGSALERLAPLIEHGPTSDAAIEVTWLRLLHRAGEMERALEWLKHRERDGVLNGASAGIGSLIALDAADYEASLRWAEVSLQEASCPPEAYVARASLALSQGEAARARALLAVALRSNGDDGRVWSAIGFVELLDRRLDAARAAFDRATAAMPGHIGTWHGLGWTALAQRDLHAARQAFEAALALDRNFAESHGGMAVVCVLSGDASGARAAIDRAVGLDKAVLSARYAEALLSGNAGDAQSLSRLAARLFAGKRAPLGEDMNTVLDLFRVRR